MKRRSVTFQASSFTLPLGSKTAVMGIINMTPDSFSQDGQLKGKMDVAKTVRLAQKMVRQGADILDVGGQSTRPGAKNISESEELKRVIPVIKALAQKVKVPISVDTFKARVAQEALDAGASIVNNIKGTKFNKTLLKMVERYKAGLIMMHIQGTPKTMQKNVRYKNVVEEVKKELRTAIDQALESGIDRRQLMIDPGIGFGKTVEHNLQLINGLPQLAKLGYPILLGASRKSFIGQVLDAPVDQRLFGSLATVAVGITKGVGVVRVHDVKETVDVVRMTEAILNA